MAPPTARAVKETWHKQYKYWLTRVELHKKQLDFAEKQVEKWAEKLGKSTSKPSLTQVLEELKAGNHITARQLLEARMESDGKQS